MKVYTIKSCGGYRLPSYYDDNSMKQMNKVYMLLNKKIEFDSSMTFKFDFCGGASPEKIPGDLMLTNAALLWVANERAKEIIQSAYGDFFRFYPAEGTDEQGNRYYVFIPSEYIELKEAVDIDSSWFGGRPAPYHVQAYEGIYDYFDIKRFCFKEKVKNYPVFRLKQSGHNKKTGKAEADYENCDIFVLDEFVQLVKENNLTGMDFTPVYDSENFDLTKEKEEAAAFNGKFIMIPKSHENGVFTSAELGSPNKPGRPFAPVSPSEYLTVEYDGRMITNSSNDYTVYDVENCDMLNDIKAAYRGGRLQAVYVFSGGSRLPVYICYELSADKSTMKRKLMNTVNECSVLCSEDLMNELKKYPRHIGALSFEYYYDGEQMHMNLQDREENVYPIGNEASHLLRCICNCTGEISRRSHSGSDFGHTVFESILELVRERLLEEIPKRFKLSSDFEVSEPRMYD